MEDLRELSDSPRAALKSALQALMAQGWSHLLRFQLLLSSTAWPGPGGGGGGQRDVVVRKVRGDPCCLLPCSPTSSSEMMRRSYCNSSTLTLSWVDNCLPIQTIIKMFIITERSEHCTPSCLLLS